MATSWIHLLPQQVAFPAGGSSTAAAPAALGPTSRFSQYMQVPGSRAGFAFVESAPSGMLSPPQAGFGVTEEGVHSIVALGGRKRKLAALLSSPKDDDNMGASAGGRERSDWKRTGGDDENLISLVIGNAAKRQRKRFRASGDAVGYASDSSNDDTPAASSSSGITAPWETVSHSAGGGGCGAVDAAAVRAYTSVASPESVGHPGHISSGVLDGTHDVLAPAPSSGDLLARISELETQVSTLQEAGQNVLSNNSRLVGELEQEKDVTRILKKAVAKLVAQRTATEAQMCEGAAAIDALNADVSRLTRENAALRAFAYSMDSTSYPNCDSGFDGSGSGGNNMAY